MFGVFAPIATAATTTLAVTSVGNFDQWTANSGTKVAAVATNDSDTLYISESTNGEKQSFVFANAGISPGAVVNSVRLNVRTKRDGGSNSTIRLFVEKGLGGTDYDEGSNKTAGSSYSTESQTWNTNPFTGDDWTAAEVNAWTSRFGVRLNDTDAVRVTYAELVVDFDVYTCNGLDATIVGTTGGETINGTAGDDVIVGRGGTDTINGNGGNDTICGGNGNDTITTTGGNDWIDAGDGTNNINAGEGNNTVTGGSGNDTIVTGDGDDTIDAGNGTNNITAGNGMNTITGGSGNDTVTTGSGDDVINVGNGTNNVNAGDGNNTVTGGSGNDTVTTGSGDDVINVGNGTNNVNAGDGNDSIVGGTGNDTLNGGDGYDYIDDGAGGTDSSTNGEGSGAQGIVVVSVDTTPDMPGQAFDFTGTSGITSVNGEDSIGVALAAGTYTAVQTGEAGWNLDSIVCTTDAGTSGNIGTSTATFDLDVADVLTCTFANSTVVDTTPPAVPTHLSPADGSTLTTLTIGIIDWTDETDPSSPVTYIYQSATDSATNPDGSFVTPAYTSGNLAVSEINAAGTPEGTYYWHVRSVDDEGNMSDWSSFWTIIVNDPVCGDSVIEGGETCDDGNTDDGDGCDMMCQIEPAPMCNGFSATIYVRGNNRSLVDPMTERYTRER